MLSTDQNINTISEALERLKKNRSQTNSAVACVKLAKCRARLHLFWQRRM